ncbi:putative UDP-N-acetylglucosamine--peptide N-acetylglucosaminyltransferase SPINDLY [Dissostichus eleginoides]|uniref:UDP-N-acetylglucosamine--peptide N-acetylglucosaminyltransferase SPINDLY n=1 Tax=Dissostichus eleginoides TaxID=100907 RepID=A0AAD9C7S9_DISEL|nr:putative UDP-N-acetylglucosamine--peptide N-acetylglucosaminyltransferase SPINDLY [Dissostichus eleginoides]
MFEIALNKCTVLLSTTGLEGNIPTIEALIWAQRAVPQQPPPNSPSCSGSQAVSQPPLLVQGRTAPHTPSHAPNVAFFGWDLRTAPIKMMSRVISSQILT